MEAVAITNPAQHVVTSRPVLSAHIQSSDVSKTVHRTTFRALGWGDDVAFPLTLQTDLGNGRVASLKTMSVCKPIHALYRQEGSDLCIIIVKEEK